MNRVAREAHKGELQARTHQSRRVEYNAEFERKRMRKLAQKNQAEDGESTDHKFVAEDEQKQQTRSKKRKSHSLSPKRARQDTSVTTRSDL